MPVKLKINTTFLDFGGSKVGSPKGPMNVVVHNPKGGINNKLHLSVLMQGLSGGVSPFIATDGCEAALAPGAKCTIGVTFEPTAVGVQKGTLVIFDNAKHEPQMVKLKGKGK